MSEGRLRGEVAPLAADAPELGLYQVIAENGVAEPTRVPPIGDAELRRIYRGMLTIRVMDERLLALQRQGRIGFYAEARGQEAAVIGAVAALAPDDFVVPAHRELGAVLYRGLPLRSGVNAQYFANTRFAFTEVHSIAGDIETGAGLGPRFNGTSCTEHSNS